MHFLLVGASGRTGQHVLTALLSQNHTATALIRPSSTLTPRPGLTIIIGSPLSKPDIHAACLTHPPDAAIFTLNAVRASESPFAKPLSPPRFLADSCANLCDVLNELGVKRVVVMSTAGVGDSWGNLPVLSKMFLGWTNVKFALRDHEMLDQEMRKRKVEWTLVRAMRLEYEERKAGVGERDVRTLGSQGEGMRMSDCVNVVDVARFLVQVAVEGLFLQEAVVVAN
jgi:putative NADH-flavin reductase